MERLLFVSVLCGLCCGAFSQFSNPAYGVRAAADSLNYFSLNLFATLTEKPVADENIAIAPYVVWSILGVINEGALNRTEHQITNALNLQKPSFKDAYRYFNANITNNAEGINLIFSNAIFIPEKEKERLNPQFEQIARNYYGVEVRTEQFEQLSYALSRMNQYMAKATRNKISEFFLPGDLQDVDILLGSALYFKGSWMVPFNKSRTSRELFYNEQGQAIGQVQMMYQIGPFPYATIFSLSALAVELPYGKGDKMSMIVLLPKKGTTVNKVLRTLAEDREKRFAEVLNVLEKAEQDYSDEDVQVYLPKFSIHSDLVLNEVLHNMGIRDLFNSQDADLRGMVNNYLFVSRLVQRAVIDVDEEGTEAAAVAGASFINKSPPPNFRADRPFAFLIVDKPTKSVIFAGKVMNPTRG